MKEIKDIKELLEIEEKQYRHAYINDLLYFRYYKHLINGYILLMGADAIEYMETYYIKEQNFEKMKDYIEHYFTKI